MIFSLEIHFTIYKERHLDKREKSMMPSEETSQQAKKYIYNTMNKRLWRQCIFFFVFTKKPLILLILYFILFLLMSILNFLFFYLLWPISSVVKILGQTLPKIYIYIFACSIISVIFCLYLFGIFTLVNMHFCCF